MTAGLVLDLSHVGTSPMLAAMQTANPNLLCSRDALCIIQMARETQTRYVVLVGQLHKPTAGVVAALVMYDGLIDAAMLAAHSRMGELRARFTCWVISGDDDLKVRLSRRLADARQMEGCA